MPFARLAGCLEGRTHWLSEELESLVQEERNGLQSADSIWSGRDTTQEAIILWFMDRKLVCFGPRYCETHFLSLPAVFRSFD